MLRTERIINLEARMKYGVASRRPLQFSELKEMELGAFTAVNFLSPSGMEGGREPIVLPAPQRTACEWPLTVLSFVLGEIRNELLPAQEAPRQKQGASGKVSVLPPSLNLAPPLLSPMIFH